MTTTKKPKKRHGYNTQIFQVSNGLVVKIGCQMFVAQPDDLKQLVMYYKGQVPADYKKRYRDTMAFIRTGHGDVLQAEAPEECVTEGSPEFRPDLPDPLCHYPRVSVYKVANGWVVQRTDGVFICTEEQDMLNRITGPA